MKKGWILCCLAFLFACSGPEKSSLKIASAANMQYALEALAEAFEESTSAEVDLIVSSSGKLTAQITAGAPFDLFFSADLKYPQQLYEDGLTSQAPKIYASGMLVIWSENAETKVSLQSLTQANSIAIANPKTAPYGIAAEYTLAKMGILDHIRDKLVFGESINQVNQFIMSKSVDIGFSSMSTVVANEEQIKGDWMLVPLGYHPPLDQAMVVIDRGQDTHPKAQAFFDFVLSTQGQEILNNFGYAIPEEGFE